MVRKKLVVYCFHEDGRVDAVSLFNSYAEADEYIEAELDLNNGTYLFVVEVQGEVH